MAKIDTFWTIFACDKFEFRHCIYSFQISILLLFIQVAFFSKINKKLIRNKDKILRINYFSNKILSKFILWKFRINDRTEPNRIESNRTESNSNVMTLIHINDCSVRSFYRNIFGSVMSLKFPDYSYFPNSSNIYII